MKLAEHVEKIVGDHTSLEPRLVRLETPAARLVPPQRILALLDPVRYSAAVRDIEFNSEVQGCSICPGLAA